MNPLHDVITQNNYKDKYYKKLLPLGQKYAEVWNWYIFPATHIYMLYWLLFSVYICFNKKHCLSINMNFVQPLPWGDKITSESLKFFSPIVIWSKFTPCPSMHEILYSAFMDYFKVLLLWTHVYALSTAFYIQKLCMPCVPRQIHFHAAFPFPRGLELGLYCWTIRRH